MDERGFRRFLKKAGKKPHVVDCLVKGVETVVAHFNTTYKIGLDEVMPPLLQTYGESLPRKEAKAQMRALWLYYIQVCGLGPGSSAPEAHRLCSENWL